MDDKKLEAFVDGIMEEAPLESPSADFTKNVMQKLEVEAPQQVFEYKPILIGQDFVLGFCCFCSLGVSIGFTFGSG